jgi:hypothetical protein
MTVTDSVVDGNGAQNFGAGGIWADEAALFLERVTVSNNSATDDATGGVGVRNTFATLRNVTISGNTAGNFATAGLGVAAGSEIEVQFTTIANNVAAGPSATGGLASFGDLTIANSLLAATNTPLVCFQTGGSSAGNNFDAGNTCGFNDPTDHPNTPPLLFGLGENGGFSPTHSLDPSSPAIDAAGACALAVDQRIIPRPQGPACDSGAVEVGDVVTQGRAWGDILCNTGAEADDAAALLAIVAGVEGAQTAGDFCPSAGQAIFVHDWFIDHAWGDVNCDGVVDALDVLLILRYAATGLLLTPISPCPDVGEIVQIA